MDKDNIEITLPFSGFSKTGHPILSPNQVGHKNGAVYNPAAIYDNGKFYLIFRMQKEWFKTSYLMLGSSSDGLNWEIHKDPIITPTLKEELKGGCEDPRIVKIKNRYYLTYTAYDGRTARLCIATSKDLKDWEKHGAILSNFGWTKSGAIMTEKVNGKYFMYFGDSNIWVATSEDLIHWVARKKNVVLRPRRKMFDSRLVEPGPPPIITDDYILLIYNSADSKMKYSVGWAAFSKSDPTKLIARSEEPLLVPNYDWELKGQVDNVCFAEGLIYRDGDYYLYYGGADTYIGLAKAKGEPQKVKEKVHVKYPPDYADKHSLKSLFHGIFSLGGRKKQ
ncbi:MAG: glycoside hydrolase family 130 protein [Promethearchaeota archaeon]